MLWLDLSTTQQGDRTRLYRSPSREAEICRADYIASWIEVLKGDKHAIFTAAAKASEAANYMRKIAEPDAEAYADMAE